MTPEGQIEDYLTRQCKIRDVLHRKFSSPSNSGVPDQILIKNGKIIFLELKAPGETLRPLQMHVTKEFTAYGADVRTADSKQKVDEILDELTGVRKSEIKKTKRSSSPRRMRSCKTTVNENIPGRRKII